MKTFTTAFSLKVLMAVAAVLFILGIAMIGSAQAGEKKKVTYTKTSTRDISRNDISPGDNPKHKITQRVRIDTIKYSDPDFGSSEDWVLGLRLSASSTAIAVPALPCGIWASRTRRWMGF